MAQKYNIPLTSTDYREIIEEGNLGAIFIVTPDNTHYPITMAALDAGLHVMCEKPLAHNSGQSLEMYERAEEVEVKHMTYFSFRWPPHHRYLKELIENGFIGRSYDFHINLLTGGGREGNYSWRYDQSHGNGMLSEYGAHMVDLSRWLIGDISKVSANLRMFMDRPGVDGGILDPTNDSVILSLEFVNGSHGVIQVSSLACIGERGMDQNITIHGESGTLEAKATFINAEIQGIREGEKEFHLQTIPDRFTESIDRENPYNIRSQFTGVYLFVDSVLKDQPIVPSFYEGHKAQEVIDAAKISDKKECWISV
jgi:predicted dehydrogenase